MKNFICETEQFEIVSAPQLFQFHLHAPKDFVFVWVELGFGGLVKRRATLASRPP
jgi:hypothetical protein